MSNKSAVELLKLTIIEEGGMGHTSDEPPLDVCQEWLEEEFDEVYSLLITHDGEFDGYDKVVKVGNNYIKYRYDYGVMDSLDSLRIVEKPQ